MSGERGGQSLARTLQQVLRAEKRRVAREQFGRCLCRRPISEHFDLTNQFLPCHQLAVDAERSR